MKIETEHTPVQMATHELIDQYFQRIGEEDDFIVLIKDASDYDFLQVAFDAGACVDLEYQEEREKTLYRCTREVSLEEARKLFHDYLNQNPNWMAELPWETVKNTSSLLESRPVKIVFFVMVILAALVGALEFFMQCFSSLVD